MFIVLLISAMLIVVSVGVFVKYNDEWDLNWQSLMGIIGTSLFGLVFLTLAITWPSGYHSYKAEIVEYYAIKETIEESRESASDVERAALTTKIIEINSDLANAKYWGQTIFKDQYPKEYLELEYLK